MGGNGAGEEKMKKEKKVEVSVDDMLYEHKIRSSVKRSGVESEGYEKSTISMKISTDVLDVLPARIVSWRRVITRTSRIAGTCR